MTWVSDMNERKQREQMEAQLKADQQKARERELEESLRQMHVEKLQRQLTRFQTIIEDAMISLMFEGGLGVQYLKAHVHQDLEKLKEKPFIITPSETCVVWKIWIPQDKTEKVKYPCLYFAVDYNWIYFRSGKEKSFDSCGLEHLIRYNHPVSQKVYAYGQTMMDTVTQEDILSEVKKWFDAVTKTPAS